MDRWTRLRADLSHLAVRRGRGAAAAVTRLHARHPDSLLGRLYTRLWLSAPVFVLTVVGRRSGEPRTVALILTRRGDDVVVVGSNAGSDQVPAWFLNLRAAGEATIRVDGKSRHARFREVIEDDEWAECWRLIAETYPGLDAYAPRTARRFPIGVLTPAG